MVSIIGSEGKEYGPGPAAQVRAWMVGGRANLRTKARALGSEEWRRLDEFPEFGGRGALPPPLPGRPVIAHGDDSAIGQTEPGDLLDRGTRTGAALINAAVYFVCMMPGSLRMSRQLLEQNPDLAKGGFPRFDQIDLGGFRDAVIWVWAGLLAAMLVQSLLIGFRGQNIGKILAGGRVVLLDGSPAGFFRGAIVRFLLPVTIVMFLNILFPLGLFFLAVDYACMFRADGRCLHDLMAGTKVVRR